MAHRFSSVANATTRPHLWLAASDGHRLVEPVNPIEAPEVPLEIEFEGLSLEQQWAALAGFPGGRRFVLRPRD